MHYDVYPPGSAQGVGCLIGGCAVDGVERTSVGERPSCRGGETSNMDSGSGPGAVRRRYHSSTSRRGH